MEIVQNQVNVVNFFQNLSLLSYNSTGWSNFKAEFIQTLLISHSIGICAIQEHFLLKNNLYRLSCICDNYGIFGIPAFKNNNIIHGGRPSGGLAILYDKRLSQFISHIVVPNSYRVQAIELKIVGESYTFINCYFPTDPRANNFDETVLINTLEDINFIFDKIGPNANYVLMGDINCDFVRNTTFVQTIKNYINDRNMMPIWNLFQCDFTFSQMQVRNNQNCIFYSTLDHFIISESILDSCIDAAPIHLAENSSNHDPIFLKLNFDLGDIELHNNIFVDDKVTKPCKPAWNKASEFQIQSYIEELTARLALIRLPENVLTCKNLQCNDPTHINEIDIYALDIMDAISKSVKTNIPYTSVGARKKIIPGWREYIKPYKDDAAFWHAIWESAARPLNNNLHLIMKKTRNKYHHILRIVKNREKQLRDDRFIDECLHGNVNNIYKEIRQQRHQRSSPPSIDGVKGTKNIACHFKNIYSRLYNTHTDQNEVQSVKARIQNKISQTDYNIIDKITPHLISKLLKRLKAGKNDVEYDWRSEALKFANDVISYNVSELFKMYIGHGHMTEAFLKSALVPIIKDPNGMHSSSDNYRAIAISSIIVKLMDYVIFELEPDAFATSQFQFGFKSNVSTTLCSWAVLETTNFFTNRGGIVYACFLDLKKAFDLVKLSVLFSKLEKKLSPILLRMIIFCYINQCCCVRWNSSDSSCFRSTNGVRQGASISPMLFSLYIDDLFTQLQNSGEGCHIQNQFMGAFSYADDIVLLSPSKSGLQNMIKICENFFNIHGIKISVDENPKKSKTQCMVFNWNQDIPVNLKIGNIRIPWTERYKHLGHYIHKDESMGHDLNAKRGEFISQIHSLRQEFGNINPYVFLKLVNTYCTSFYGSNIWDLSSLAADKLWSCWNVFLKSSMNLPYATHRYFLNNINNQKHLKIQLLKRFVKFHNTILATDSNLIKILFEVQNSDVRSVFGRNCIMARNLCGTSNLTCNNISQHVVYPIPAGEKWSFSLVHELLYLRIYGSTLLNTEEIDRILNLICCD